MKFSFHDIGKVHFIGIGGIGMSGIADALLKFGYKVSGSDISDNSNTKRLRALGADIFIGHDATNVADDVSAIVVSSAIKKNNPELLSAKAKNIPIVHRSEMLAELMKLKKSIAIAGTHGKTTTTSLMAMILEEAGIDPTVINGGIINAYQNNAKIGRGDFVVVEADESDGSFLRLPSDMVIVTNIDAEHMEHYHTFENLYDSFKTFVQNIPFYGVGVICYDHKIARKLLKDVKNRQLISYGFDKGADVRAINRKSLQMREQFDVVANIKGKKIEIKDVELSIFGDHNVSNALATIALALYLKIDVKIIKKALANFSGVKRRFTHVGNFKGMQIIEDYGHHPVEISNVLRSAKNIAGNKVVAVFQPHRYSRVHNLFEEFCQCFSDADVVFIADIYAASEQPIKGVDKNSLVKGIRKYHKKEVFALECWDEIKEYAILNAKEGDYLIFLGAGNVNQWAYDLYDALLGGKKE